MLVTRFKELWHKLKRENRKSGSDLLPRIPHGIPLQFNSEERSKIYV
jgi:hypothetical protein